MISFKAQHSDADLERWIQEDMQDWFDELVEDFRQTGRDYVDRARAKTKQGGGFGNITWDLRSSIIMVLAVDGKIIETYSPPIAKGSGFETGKKLADEVVASMGRTKGVAMAIVAGMDYALFVERREYDVISGSGLKFESDLNALLR